MSHEIALQFDPVNLQFDIAIDSNGDLVHEEGLRTAVILSLFVDARAQPGDEIPDGGNDKRGYWADEFSAIEGDKFGSRLWLLSRSKVTDQVIEAARAHTAEALQWLVDDGVARQVNVSAELARDNMLALTVEIYRAVEPPILYRFDNFWSTSDAI